MFLGFGAVLVVTGLKLLRDTVRGAEHGPDPDRMRVVRLARRLGLRPFAVVVIAVLATDVVFAVDSVPAVYGVTGDPYLVFVTNVFALLGLRALYFVLRHALASLAHLGYGLAAILVVIGVKLALTPTGEGAVRRPAVRQHGQDPRHLAMETSSQMPRMGA